MSKYNCEKCGKELKPNELKYMSCGSYEFVCNDCAEKQMPSKLTEKIADLEAKLAESESNVKVGEFWHSAYQGKQLDYDKVYAELRQAYDENEQLKQQLAEKEKEIEKYKELCTISKLEDLQVENMLLKGKNQNKISFCIEQLEKVKEYCRQEAYHDSYGDYMIVYERRYYEDDEEKTPNDDLMGFLDNLLKGMR